MYRNIPFVKNDRAEIIFSLLWHNNGKHKKATLKGIGYEQRKRI
jgi:hypothetical protein